MATPDILQKLGALASSILPINLLRGTSQPVPISAEPLQTDPRGETHESEEDKETVLLVGPDLWRVIAAEDGNKIEKENAEKFAADPEYYRSLAKGEIRDLAKVLEDQGYNVIILDAELKEKEGETKNSAILYDKVYIRDSIERLSFSFINQEGEVEKIDRSNMLIPLHLHKHDRQAEPKEVVRQLLEEGIIQQFIGPVMSEGDQAGEINFDTDNVSPFDSNNNEYVEGGDFKYVRYHRYIAGYGDRNTEEGLEKLQNLTGIPVYKYKLKTDGAHFHIDVTARILETNGVLIVDKNGFANDAEYDRFIDEQLLAFMPRAEKDIDENGDFTAEAKAALIDRYVIQLSEKDAKAYATNFVQLKNGTLLIPDGVSDDFIAELKAKDPSYDESINGNAFKIIKVPMKTLLMAGGAVHCTTNTEASVLFGGKVTRLDHVNQYKTPGKHLVDTIFDVDPLVTVNFLSHSDVFYKNPKTSQSNSYQHDIEESLEESSRLAFKELDEQRELQTQHHVLNLSFKAPDGKPDAIFPNNSVVMRYVNGQMKAMLCPMSPGRQYELPPEIKAFLVEVCGEDNVLDLRGLQPHHDDPKEEGKCFEGTGVMNFDEEGCIYVNKSYRSDDAFFNLAKTFFEAPEIYAYDAFTKEYFEQVNPILGDIDNQRTDHSEQKENRVYHNNVIQFIGNKVVATCRESIPEGQEKEKLDCRLQEFANQGKLVLDLTHDQIDAFTGNGLESINDEGNEVLLISDTAFNALTETQKQQIISVYGPENIIQKNGKFGAKLPITQDAGGGGIRCTNWQVNVPRSIALKIAEAYAKHLGHLSLGATPTQQRLAKEGRSNDQGTLEQQFYAAATR